MRLEIQDPSLKEHIMTTLAERAEGMFRWAACQMDYLCECSNDKDRREALTKLPPDLPSSYERILERVNRSTKENQALVQSALHWIVYALEPMPTQTLLQALAVRDGDTAFESSGMTTERRLLHWCSSLVRKRNSGGLELAHFTVKEFLLAIDPLGRPLLSPYRLSGDHTVLTKACVNILKCESFDGNAPPNYNLTNPRSDEDDPTEWEEYERKTYELDEFEKCYSFFTYAVGHWRHHTYESSSTKTDEHVLELFLPKAAGSFRTWIFAWLWHDKARKIIDHVDIPDGPLKPSPLHWAACFGLASVCDKLLASGSDPDRQSVFGTPLNCALWWTLAVYPVDDAIREDAFYEYGYPTPPESRRLTVKAILGAGASASMVLSPPGFEERRALDIVLLMECVDGESFPLTLLILDAGGIPSALNFVLLISQTRCYTVNDADDLHPVRPAIVESMRNNIHSVDYNTICLFVQYLLWSLVAAFPGSCSEYSVETEFLSTLLGDLGGGSGRAAENTDNIQVRYVRMLSEALRLSSLKISQGLGNFWSDILSSVLDDNNYSMFNLLFSFNFDPNISYNRKYSKEDTYTLLHNLLDTDCEEQEPSFKLEQKVRAIEGLVHYGAPVTATNDDGISPLDLAAQNWSFGIFRLLWNSVGYEKLCEIHQGQVDKIFYVAITENKELVADFLMQELRDSQKLYGYSLLLYAIGQDSRRSLDLILGYYSEFSQLFGPGLPVPHCTGIPNISGAIFQYLVNGSLLDSHGNTAFHSLSTRDDYVSQAKIRILLALGEAHDELNFEGWTPLALSIQWGNTAVTKLFLDAGAGLEVGPERDYPVLNLACCLGNGEAVRLLLDRGADPM